MEEAQKFNTGDIVRCITDNYPYFTYGKEYEVGLVNAKEESMKVNDEGVHV